MFCTVNGTPYGERNMQRVFRRVLERAFPKPVEDAPPPRLARHAMFRRPASRAARRDSGRQERAAATALSTSTSSVFWRDGIAWKSRTSSSS